MGYQESTPPPPVPPPPVPPHSSSTSAHSSPPPATGMSNNVSRDNTPDSSAHQQASSAVGGGGRIVESSRSRVGFVDSPEIVNVSPIEENVDVMPVEVEPSSTWGEFVRRELEAEIHSCLFCPYPSPYLSLHLSISLSHSVSLSISLIIYLHLSISLSLSLPPPPPPPPPLNLSPPYAHTHTGQTLRRGGARLGRAVGNFFGVTEESQHGTSDQLGWARVGEMSAGETFASGRRLSFRGILQDEPPPEYPGKHHHHLW